jgi:hypothetical protein
LRLAYSLFLATNHLEQRNQLPKLSFLEMPELLAMNRADLPVHLLQQLQTGLRNSRRHVSPILAAALT